MSTPGQTAGSSLPGAESKAPAFELAVDLTDAQGPIPVFPPRYVDEHGRLIPLPDQERRARSEAVLRTLAALRELPDEDPSDTMEQMMRGLDAHRPPGRKLFEEAS
jgi:hypothetical protein